MNLYFYFYSKGWNIYMFICNKNIYVIMYGWDIFLLYLSYIVRYKREVEKDNFIKIREENKIFFFKILCEFLNNIIKLVNISISFCFLF